jgi:protein-disulfide isomerase
LSQTPRTPQATQPTRTGGLLRLAAAAIAGALATLAVLWVAWSPGVAPRPDARAPDAQSGQGTLRGDPQAPVEIVVYSDFQCPFCARQYASLDRLVREHGDAVRIQFRHLPNPGHPAGIAAHHAALAADRQGRFWEMHDRIFANPQRLTRDAFLGYAREIGLDERQFERDLDDPMLDRVIDRDRAEAARIGITEAPALVVNGKVIPGAQPYALLLRLVDQARDGADRARPALLSDPRVREWVAVSRKGVAN